MTVFAEPTLLPPSWQSRAEVAEAKVESLEQQLADAKKALQVFMEVMAFAPSSVPGAIEEGLNRAYKMGQTIFNQKRQGCTAGGE